MTKAAEELCVTQAAVSRQVRALEIALGTNLFRRNHRGVSLTRRGLEYFSVVTRIFSELESATAVISGVRGRSSIQICAHNTFNMRWLIPRLPDFRAQHPQIAVSLTSFARSDELDMSQFDAVIQTGTTESLGGGAVLIAPIELAPTCSPSLVKRGLRVPADLRDYTLLHSVNRPDAWAKWLAFASVREVDPMSGLRFDNGILCYQAAIEGLGIAIAERNLVYSDIKSGALTHPFRFVYREQTGYYFVKSQKTETPAMRSFRDWLIKQSAAEREAALQLHPSPA